MPRRKTTEEFIHEARSVYGDKYDYSKVCYVNSQTKVLVICPDHGEFWAIPNNFLKGHKCPTCSGRQHITKEVFISRSIALNGDAYICKDIRLQRRYADERIRFMRSSNKTSAAKSIIRRYSGCQLDDSDYEYLGNLFICFFNRSDRKRPDLSQKSDLLEKQQFKCNICGKPINTSDELDHIVPYDFVGDELPDNAQMLCKTCNTRKGNSTGYGLVVLLKQGKKSG